MSQTKRYKNMNVTVSNVYGAVPSVVPGELGDLGELGDPGVPGNK